MSCYHANISIYLKEGQSYSCCMICHVFDELAYPGCICFYVYSQIINYITTSFSPTFSCSFSSFSGPLLFSPLLHLFQALHVWWPCCLIRSWRWPTSETRAESFAIKTAMPSLYRTTTNLTSWKNARGSRRLVREQLQSRLFSADY